MLSGPVGDRQEGLRYRCLIRGVKALLAVPIKTQSVKNCVINMFLSHLITMKDICK